MSPGISGVRIRPSARDAVQIFPEPSVAHAALDADRGYHLIVDGRGGWRGDLPLPDQEVKHVRLVTRQHPQRPQDRPHRPHGLFRFRTQVVGAGGDAGEWHALGEIAGVGEGRVALAHELAAEGGRQHGGVDVTGLQSGEAGRGLPGGEEGHVGVGAEAQVADHGAADEVAHRLQPRRADAGALELGAGHALLADQGEVGRVERDKDRADRRALGDRQGHRVAANGAVVELAREHARHLQVASHGDHVYV